MNSNMTPLRSTLPRPARPMTSTTSRPRDVSTLDDTSLVAMAIVEMGRRRRAESLDADMPPRGSTAWQILRAAAKARGEDVGDDVE